MKLIFYSRNFAISNEDTSTVTPLNCNRPNFMFKSAESCLLITISRIKKDEDFSNIFVNI